MKLTGFCTVAALFVLLLFAAPVLAAQEDQAGDEDHYKLKDEWKNKHMVVERHGELTQVVFLDLKDISVPAGDANLDAYILGPYYWSSTPIKYFINPSTAAKNYRLKTADVVEAVTKSFETWDDAVSTKNVFDPPTINTKARASLAMPDYKNVVTWGAVSDKNVIAVTNIWYYPSTGQIVDTDIVFNTYYKWGIDKDGEGTTYTLGTSKFDIQNIGTHEAGHICCLGDIYDPTYSEMTMFGYADFGEVNKISLESGDIAGVNAAFSR